MVRDYRLLRRYILFPTRQGRNAMRNQPIPLEKPVALITFGRNKIDHPKKEINVCCLIMYVKCNQTGF
jgi:hypothetical protein